MGSEQDSVEITVVLPTQTALISAIACLAKDLALPAGLTSDALFHRQQRGFLMSGYSASTYRKFASKRQLHARLVDRKLASFLLGYYSHDQTDPDDFGSLFIRQTFGSNVAIIKQIGSAPTFSKQGHARALYDAFQINVQGEVYAAIVKEPRNIGSEEFHSRAGFKECGLFMHPDQHPRGIWVRSFFDEQ